MKIKMFRGDHYVFFWPSSGSDWINWCDASFLFLSDRMHEKPTEANLQCKISLFSLFVEVNNNFWEESHH